MANPKDRRVAVETWWEAVRQYFLTCCAQAADFYKEFIEAEARAVEIIRRTGMKEITDVLTEPINKKGHVDRLCKTRDRWDSMFRMPESIAIILDAIFPTVQAQEEWAKHDRDALWAKVIEAATDDNLLAVLYPGATGVLRPLPAPTRTGTLGLGRAWFDVWWTWVRDKTDIRDMALLRVRNEARAAKSADTDLSLPMSMQELAARLGNMGVDKCRTFLEGRGALLRVSRQQWQVDRSKVDPATWQRIVKGQPSRG